MGWLLKSHLGSRSCVGVTGDSWETFAFPLNRTLLPPNSFEAVRARRSTRQDGLMRECRTECTQSKTELKLSCISCSFVWNYSSICILE